MLIRFDDVWVPETSIKKIWSVRGTKPPREIWHAELVDGDRISGDWMESRSVLPNTTGVRMLCVFGSLAADGTLTHGTYERPIVAWMVDSPIDDDGHQSVRAVGCEFDLASNVVRCYFDPQTGAHWNDDGCSDTRDGAVEFLLGELKEQLSQR